MCLSDLLLDQSLQVMSVSKSTVLGPLCAVPVCVRELMRSQGMDGFGERVGLIVYYIQWELLEQPNCSRFACLLASVDGENLEFCPRA